MVSKLLNFKKFIGIRVFNLFGFTIIVGLCWFFIELLFVIVTQQLLFVLGVLKEPSEYMPDFISESLTLSISLLAIFGLFRFALLYLKTYLNIVVGESFVSNYREKLLAVLIKLDGSVASHRFMELFSDRVSGASLFLSNAVTFSISSVTLFCLALFAFKLAPYEMLFSISALIILLLPLKVLNSKIHVAGNNYVKESTLFNQVILESIKNIFILQIYHKVSSQLSIAIDSVKRYEKNAKDYYKIFALKNSYPQFSGLIVITLVLLVSKKNFETSSLELLAFFYLFVRISQAASEVSSSLSELKKNLPGIRYLKDAVESFEFEVDLKTQVDEVGVKIKSAEQVEIKLDQLYFSYDNKNNVFNGITFKFYSGKICYLIGQSGAGKSTLLLLIFGVLKPSSGKVIINNVENNSFTKLNSDDIGYVGPENFVIEGTLRENFLYLNNKEVFDSEISELMTIFELNSIFSITKDGLDTYVTSTLPLSTGQKQRLSIVRALLRKPKVLILDEATSNLDLNVESKIMDYIRLITKKNKITVIAISHRKNFSEYCDYSLIL